MLLVRLVLAGADVYPEEDKRGHGSGYGYGYGYGHGYGSGHGGGYGNGHGSGRGSGRGNGDGTGYRYGRSTTIPKRILCYSYD